MAVTTHGGGPRVNGAYEAAGPSSEELPGWVHVGRQPVYSTARVITGYELRFRGREGNGPASPATVDDAAVTRLIASTFADFGLDTLVGRRTGFVNITRSFLVGELPVPLPYEQTVLELPTLLVEDDETRSGAASLVSAGYRLAVDVLQADPTLVPLLGYATYARLKVSALTPGGLVFATAALHARGLQVIGHSITTAGELDSASVAGVDLLQGPYLAGSDVVSAPALTPSRLAALRLVPRLTDPDLEISDIERIVKTDPSLTYRLLRAANSAASASIREITSLRDAIVMLGLRQLRSWLLLMLVGDASAASEEQLASSLTCARACELLAPESRLDADEAFLAGLLASLIPVLGLDSHRLSAELGLADHLAAALEGAGRLGRLVAAVRGYEEGSVPTDNSWGPSAFDLSRAWLTAVGWSLQTSETVLARSA